MQTDHPPIRWGIVGTGGIATTLAEDISLVADAEVAAVASRDQMRADAFASRHQIPQAFGSYADLVDAEVDVVYIATPHSDHDETAAMFLRAGVPLLVEKPLTPTLERTERLLALAEQTQTFCMEAVWMRCNPLIRQAVALVAEGTLGELRHASASFGFRFEVDDDHRLLNPELAGGAILDLGCYPAHFIEGFLGGPAAVFARGTLAPTGVDATSSAQFVWPDPRITATAFISLEASVTPRAELVGERGRLFFDNFVRPESMTLITHSDPEPQVFRTYLPGHGYTFEIDEVGRCVRAGLGGSPLVDAGSTRRVAGMLDAWRSALNAATGLTEIGVM